VLTQVRHDRITIGIGSLHLSRKIIPRHGVHRAPAFLTRTIVTGFRMFPSYQALVAVLCLVRGLSVTEDTKLGAADERISHYSVLRGS
jgi:hypothetical protein